MEEKVELEGNLVKIKSKREQYEEENNLGKKKKKKRRKMKKKKVQVYDENSKVNIDFFSI